MEIEPNPNRTELSNQSNRTESELHAVGSIHISSRNRTILGSYMHDRKWETCKMNLFKRKKTDDHLTSPLCIHGLSELFFSYFDVRHAVFAARCYASAAYAVTRHLPFSPSGSHTIVVFPYQTSWQLIWRKLINR